MFVVPLFKDVIETSDGSKYKVVEYTNYKDGGPAIYVKSPAKELILVYFFDIVSINGTKVEYQKGNKLFKALGKVPRAYQLPQPEDKIVVLTKESSSEQEGKEEFSVDTLKLKSKSLGINKGLFVKDTDGNYYRLKQIYDIDPALGGSSFERDKFLEYYKDYLGV